MFKCCASRPAPGGRRPPAAAVRGRAEDAVPRTAGGDDGSPISVVLLGEESCGKTSLVQRFAAQDFRLLNEVNMGAALTERVVILRPPGEAARAVQLNIWDTPGSKKVHHLAQMYYKAAKVAFAAPQAAVVVYDVTSEDSFKIMKEWVAELKSLGPCDVRLIIAGNKCDRDRNVATDVAEEYARESNATYFEVSARTGKGVDMMFKEAAKGVNPPVAEEGDDGMMRGLRNAAGAAGARLARRASLDRQPAPN